MKWTLTHLDDIGIALLQHLALVATATVISFALSMALGIWISRRPRLYTIVIAAAALLYTVPSLALFAMLIPLLGLGFAPAVIGLIAYSILILVRNVATGFREVPAEVIDAADGMGYSTWQRLAQIELPLALPIIIGGLRITLVTQIGVATIAAYINAGGLGSIIFAGINQRFPEKIFVGALLASLLAVVADLGLGWLERRLKTAQAG